jgi:hypothetical protein
MGYKAHSSQNCINQSNIIFENEEKSVENLKKLIGTPVGYNTC